MLTKIFRVMLVLSLLFPVWLHPADYANASEQASFYVDPSNGNDANPGSLSSPFRTIERARDAVRVINANMSDDIIIYLRGGKYEMSETWQLTEVDSGTNGHNVVYQAYPGEVPILSGGRNITGWVLYDTDRNIYKAIVGSDIETRQLYVNGKRAVRARSEGDFRIAFLMLMELPPRFLILPGGAT
ncbi:DUF1565 domain-containing protein [Paenibacillus hexagrammi]|uniref:DUF1565 domain-containing protein n=1 Tax=Paenibacillus hexagrammi TaxID=2908839 RepID=A0ABY3SJR7_9BACL|nr:DUF1565 domain-containing protein [Paenibacillus sp. YPD9-1]UJF34297.1 DUF1565 domain-containing protein [Paenibacillus sp. YPD9-1]